MNTIYSKTFVASPRGPFELRFYTYASTVRELGQVQEQAHAIAGEVFGNLLADLGDAEPTIHFNAHGLYLAFRRSRPNPNFESARCHFEAAALRAGFKRGK